MNYEKCIKTIHNNNNITSVVHHNYYAGVG